MGIDDFRQVVRDFVEIFHWSDVEGHHVPLLVEGSQVSHDSHIHTLTTRDTVKVRSILGGERRGKGGVNVRGATMYVCVW